MKAEHAARTPGGQAPVSPVVPSGPGDLSRRLAHRRQELGLTRQQVADRAGMSPEYVEYLERYPAQPTGATLQRLADVLQTTPPALLGGGTDAPPGRQRPGEHPALQPLTVAECRRLLAPGGVGRIAFTTPDGPAVLPVNFAMAAATIVFRTGQGTQIAAHIAAHEGEQLGFEVDHLDEALAQGWSVLVRGKAHRVVRPDELGWLKASIPVWPWPGGDREVYVQIIPDQMTGRRILAG
jgi:transcriptional regulator with XRE-family HTH domain